MLFLGVDLGSTTVKYVLMDDSGAVLAKNYVRHQSAVRETLCRILSELQSISGKLCVALTGSGALALAETLEVEFIQEVLAGTRFLRSHNPVADVAVELGGEDAKLLYLSDGVELRMNEACAGGTGAFIDQMASLLDTDAAGLDAMAQQSEKSYPIASRCGVFAKTDVVSLLNAGISKSDIARSVFEAVAEQTISGLACGRPLKGKIAFLGGPLSFIKSLREAFERRLAGNDFLVFVDAHFSIAHGAALSLNPETSRQWSDIGEFLEAVNQCHDAVEHADVLEPLFASEAELEAFESRHAQHSTPRYSLKDSVGDLFLGVDLGSTTIKATLIDSEGRLVASWYEQNEGKPLPKLFKAYKALVREIPAGANIRSICTTGYGAELARAALGAQFSEVETLAHQRAAVAFDPETTYVIDIGGQDMKCLEVKQGLITSVKLNEACSSGCGSFLQTFAAQLGVSLEEFVALAVNAKHPVDLGTRCTVFMNSKVRQAQRDGAGIDDIAAGLCHSIVRNALYKVLRIRNADDLGAHVVVQGGTFLNNAVLRAFEKQIGREVVRPDIAGLMGAFGAALIAKERTIATTATLDINLDELDTSHIIERDIRCKGCGNHCLLKMNRFPSGQKFFSGNRCEFGLKAGGAKRKSSESFIEWKLERLFSGTVLTPEEAPRATVGLPRVLNMYEHYPYWRALFTELGYAVKLTAASNHTTQKAANDTIPSQSLCFPAKLAHGHIAQLAEEGVHEIWMPCIPREGVAFREADGRFACPVVGGYPEALRLNIEQSYPKVHIYTPFLDIENPKSVLRALKSSFSDLKDVSDKVILRAIEKGHAALVAYREEVRQKGAMIVNTIDDDKPLIVLASHPYHLDPLVNHGITSLIESMGVTLLTEDAVAHLADIKESLEVVNQWTFHSRLYRAAAFVAQTRNAELVQLVSFGCGLDAITSEQIRRQLERANKLFTMIKIDEGDTLGAVRIRLRSLLAAVKDRADTHRDIDLALENALSDRNELPSFTPGERTLYVPQMAPLHFPILVDVLNSLGWNVKLLPEVGPRAIELGLQHVNNDACYPAIVVIGQLLQALEEHPEKASQSAFLLAQTCGPCRATNYPNLLRWALQDLGYSDIPVTSIAGGQLHGAQTVSLGLKGLKRMMIGIIYGDLLQRLSLFVRSYETVKDSYRPVLEKWTKRAGEVAARGDRKAFERDLKPMVQEFLSIPRIDISKPKVGIVGEILLKYHPEANLDLVSTLIAEGAEPRLGDIADFVLYCFYDHIYQAQALGGSKFNASVAWLAMRYFDSLRESMKKALMNTPLPGVSSLQELLDSIKGYVSAGQQAGEGWLLTAEMIEFIRTDTPNVLCLQPFGCLPNHVTGKGVMRRLREEFEEANFCAIDFEAGTSKANVVNRLKLFLDQATGFSDRPKAAVRRTIPIVPID